MSAPQTDPATAVTTPQFVVTTEGELLGEDTTENRELVRRIEACVNACEGIPTADLESGVVKQMAELMAQVAPILESHNEEQRSAEAA